MMSRFVQELFICAAPDLSGTALRLAGLKLLAGSKHKSDLFTPDHWTCVKSMKQGSQR